MTDKKFTAAEAAQLVLEALKSKAREALEKAQKGSAVKKQAAPAGIDPARQARSDYITPPQTPPGHVPATQDASKMTFPKLDKPWTKPYPMGDSRNDSMQQPGENIDSWKNRTFGAGTAERDKKFWDAATDKDIKGLQGAPKAPAASAPKAPAAPKPPTSTKPEPLDWSEKNPEESASKEGSESTESSSSSPELSKVESLAFAAAKKFHLGDESGAAELIGLCKSEASSEAEAAEMLADAFEAFEKAQSVQFAPLSEGWQDIASGKPLDGKFDGVVPGTVKSKPSNPDRQKVQVKGDAKLTTVDKDKPIKKEEPLSGGLSEGSSTSDYDPEQLAAGTKVEMEHTDDEKAARKIAMDHLTEDPDYYKKLKTMEAEKCEGSCSKGEASASKEEVSEPLAKRPSHEWNWQEPEAGLDVEGLGREHTGYAHATDEGGYHVARVNPVEGGFNFTHSHTAPGGEEKTVHASPSFKTPHEAHAHLREYTGAK